MLSLHAAREKLICTHSDLSAVNAVKPCAGKVPVNATSRIILRQQHHEMGQGWFPLVCLFFFFFKRFFFFANMSVTSGGLQITVGGRQSLSEANVTHVVALQPVQLCTLRSTRATEPAGASYQSQRKNSSMQRAGQRADEKRPV